MWEWNVYISPVFTHPFETFFLFTEKIAKYLRVVKKSCTVGEKTILGTVVEVKPPGEKVDVKWDSQGETELISVSELRLFDNAFTGNHQHDLFGLFKKKMVYKRPYFQYF